MRNAFSILALAGLGALVFAGCTGGSSGSSSAHIRCAEGEAFCIISCDLGCTQTGCAVNEIAENQRLKFNFSQDLDPASINPARSGSRISGIIVMRGAAPEPVARIIAERIPFTAGRKTRL